MLVSLRPRGRVRAALATFAFALTSGVVVSPPADATDAFADQCVEINTLTFSPPLTTSSQLGTATMTFSNDCLVETASTSPPGESAGLSARSATYQYTYVGSCTVAALTGGQTHVVLGGTLFVLGETNVGTSPTPSAWVGRKVIALVPDKPCTDPAGETTATGVGPAWGIGLS